MPKLRQINWPLEIAKFLYVTVLSLVLFFFFSLLLDTFCFLAFGGWNPLLGKWPIFTGTVSAGFYSPLGSVISLLLGLGTMARVILDDRVPIALEFLVSKDEEGNLAEIGQDADEKRDSEDHI